MDANQEISPSVASVPVSLSLSLQIVLKGSGITKIIIFRSHILPIAGWSWLYGHITENIFGVNRF